MRAISTDMIGSSLVAVGWGGDGAEGVPGGGGEGGGRGVFDPAK